jgi:hypothetical protein
MDASIVYTSGLEESSGFSSQVLTLPLLTWKERSDPSTADTGSTGQVVSEFVRDRNRALRRSRLGRPSLLGSDVKPAVFEIDVFPREPCDLLLSKTGIERQHDHRLQPLPTRETHLFHEFFNSSAVRYLRLRLALTFNRFHLGGPCSISSRSCAHLSADSAILIC